MRQRRLDDFTRMIRFLGGSVPERRPEPCATAAIRWSWSIFGSVDADIALPRRVGKHEVAAVTECPRRVKDLNRPSAQRTRCSHFAFVRRAATAYTWSIIAITAHL